MEHSSQEVKDGRKVSSTKVTYVQDTVTVVQLVPVNVARALLGPRLLPILVYLIDQDCPAMRSLLSAHT
jgi:hypothetical protein